MKENPLKSRKLIVVALAMLCIVGLVLAAPQVGADVAAVSLGVERIFMLGGLLLGAQSILDRLNGGK